MGGGKRDTFGIREILSRKPFAARWVVASGLHAPSRGNAKSSVRARVLFVRPSVRPLDLSVHTGAKVHSCVHAAVRRIRTTIRKPEITNKDRASRRWALDRLSLSLSSPPLFSLFLFLCFSFFLDVGSPMVIQRENGNQSGRDCTEINESRIIIMASC